MPWKKLTAFTNDMKGKYVRLVSAHHAENISGAFKINTSNKNQIRINPGAVGIIYVVRGATIFIGFRDDLKTPPSRNTDPTKFGAAISFTINDIDKLEIDA